MKKWVIVNEKNNVPIQAPGFCGTYVNEGDARRTCENWNKLESMHMKKDMRAVVKQIGM